MRMLWTFSPHTIGQGFIDARKKLKNPKVSDNEIAQGPAGRCLQPRWSDWPIPEPRHHRALVNLPQPHAGLSCPKEKKDSKLWALMRSSALKEWLGISLPFPAVPAEWEQEAASTLFLKAHKQWVRMWRLNESPCSCFSPCNGIRTQDKDQLT